MIIRTVPYYRRPYRRLGMLLNDGKHMMKDVRVEKEEDRDINVEVNKEKVLDKKERRYFYEIHGLGSSCWRYPITMT